jgi:hypothetical protein
MRYVLLAGLTFATLSAEPPRLNENAPNVNSRYIVETIEVAPEFLRDLSDSLRDRIQNLIGSRFDQEVLDEIGRRIRGELRSRVVVMKVERGTKPEHLKVVFDVSSRKKREGDIVVPRFIYHSKQNFSFGLDSNWRFGDHHLAIGILTDNDELVERYSGIRGGVGRDGLADGHLNLAIEAESWRTQWNPAVETALDQDPLVPGIYRTRVGFQPSATIVFVEPLTLQLGVSLERLQTQFPAAHHELSSAAFLTLRFRRRWELTPANRHDLDASYNVRSANNTLDSDFIYTRHFGALQYTWRGTREEIVASFQAGALNGRAPLFERFALGNSRTLRGWNKFDVDPLGGDRMAHASLDYRYRWVRVIYDSGSAWRRGGPVRMRHSIAFGVTHNGAAGFSALVAFPLREGRIEPIFMTGINF